MNDENRAASVRPCGLAGAALRMMQIGFDYQAGALEVEAKRFERERVAVQHAFDALLHAQANDPARALQTWETSVRDYCTASVDLWDQDLNLATQSQAAFGELLRDLYVAFDDAWTRAQAGPAQPVATGDWLEYLRQLMGALPDGQAKPSARQRETLTAAA